MLATRKMIFFRDIFNLDKNRKSIPNSWCGLWTDRYEKQLIIHSTKHDFYSVTVLDKYGKPFQIDLLEDFKKKEE